MTRGEIALIMQQHDCARFDEQPCVFCRANTDNPGFFLVPFDVPGYYDPTGEPHVIIANVEDTGLEEA